MATMAVERGAGFEREKALSRIESAVFEEHEIVSFRWVAREFDVSARKARALLEALLSSSNASAKGGLEVVYLVAGVTKEQQHVVQLMTAEKLAREAAALEKVTAKQIYSVQQGELKDPSALWSAEYTQMESLFSEPADASNCLRDNRMSSITCKSVERLKDGELGALAKPAQRKSEGNPPASKSRGGLGLSSATTAGGGGGGISLASTGSKGRAGGGIGLSLGKAGSPQAKAGGGAKGGISLNKGSGKKKAASPAAKPAGLSLNAKKAKAKPAPSPPPARPAARSALIEESDSESDSEEQREEENRRREEQEAEAMDLDAPEEADEATKAEEGPPAPRQQQSSGGGGLSLSGGGGRKRRKVTKVFINDKGEEVVEEVVEEVDAATGGQQPTATKVTKTEVENKNPNPPTAAKKQKAKPKSKTAPKSKQMGIASFFARK
mmetsp:Transcript_15289/g.38797  ORF Transcript_15289/g.38797 Transcript_15289/m.38797 type:complete len:439 (+) Transcript_15289:16-1332(+)